MRNKKTKHFSIISINSIFFIMLIDSDVVCSFGIWYLILFILLTLLVATRLAEGRCAWRSLEICCVQLGLSACAWQLCHHCHCTDGWMDGWMDCINIHSELALAIGSVAGRSCSSTTNTSSAAAASSWTLYLSCASVTT